MKINFKKVWNTWKKVAQLIGDFIARVVLTIFYWTIFVPFGLGIRFFSDPLRIKNKSVVRWLSRETMDKVLEDGRRQF